MARRTRDDILQIHAQGDNDLERFIGNCQKLAEIYDQANQEYNNRYELYFLSIANFAVLAGKLQNAWRQLKDEKL